MSKVVLITGALTGIGRATALRYAKTGAKLVVSGRHGVEGRSLLLELRDLGSDADFFQADVRHDDEVRDLVDKAVSLFGCLDVAVNNAGTEGTPGQIIDQTVENYASIFETNVLGTLLSMKHELRIMLQQRTGSIVNVSSTFGRAGGAGASLYVASKHAVEGLTKSAALEAAESGVRVNVVAPGPIETGMLSRLNPSAESLAEGIARVPMKRFGTAEEVAKAICFLGSTDAAFITGTSLAVDGGKLAR